MIAKKTFLTVAKIQNTLAENQVQMDENYSNAKWREGFSMYTNEASNKLEQEYYDKDRGCSVKAQEDNIFDYQDFLKF